jgi:hypothetical protein
MYLYFNLFPSELDEIIISYLDEPTDIVMIKNEIVLPLNWTIISFYHFGKYKFESSKIEYDNYMKYIKLIKLKSILNLIKSK